MAHKNKPSKYHHVVPRVYQIQWSFNNSESIYAFSRKDGFSSNEIRNAGNFLGINNINSITIDDFNFLQQDGINKILSCLNGKTINGIAVKDKPSLVFTKLNITPVDFVNNIHTFEICDEHGHLVHKAGKNRFLQQIRTTKFVEIEDYFSSIDNLWETILETTNSISHKQGITQSPDLRINLERYLLCQYIRNPFFSPDIEQRIDSILSKEPIRQIFQGMPNWEKLVKSHYIKSKSIEFSNNQAIFKPLPKSINKYSQIFESMKFTLLIAPTSGFFITSDSPITFYTNIQNFSRGVYFPISPKILLYMVRVEKLQGFRENIFIKNISLQTTKYINDIILEKSIKYVISNQSTLQNLVHGEYESKEWENIVNN